MIRARKVPRSDAACHSADVLTPTERAAEIHVPRFLLPPVPRIDPEGTRWSDVPTIRIPLMAWKRSHS